MPEFLLFHKSAEVRKGWIRVLYSKESMQPREMKAEQESDIRIKGPEERGRQRRIFFSFVSMKNRQK